MVEQRAIDLILTRGVQFRVPAPRPLKWLLRGGIPLKIRPLYLGTILEIKRLTTREGDEELPLEVQAEVIALAVLNSRPGIRLLRRPLTRYLIKEVRSDSLFELFALVQVLNRERDFMSITNWATLIGREVTRPREVQEEGS